MLRNDLRYHKVPCILFTIVFYWSDENRCKCMYFISLLIVFNFSRVETDVCVSILLLCLQCLFIIASCLSYWDLICLTQQNMTFWGKLLNGIFLMRSNLNSMGEYIVQQFGRFITKGTWNEFCFVFEAVGFEGRNRAFTIGGGVVSKSKVKILKFLLFSVTENSNSMTKKLIFSVDFPQTSWRRLTGTLLKEMKPESWEKVEFKNRKQVSADDNCWFVRPIRISLPLSHSDKFAFKVTLELENSSLSIWRKESRLQFRRIRKSNVNNNHFQSQFWWICLIRVPMAYKSIVCP